MKLSYMLMAATVAMGALIAVPASANYGHNNPPPKNPPSHDPTPVPEPSDAALLLMGVGGVVIGRRLHARAKRQG